MRYTPTLPKPDAEHGFVLVTSLIFLVVITLLAVSAISSSTLQERMASNLREKSQARQAADAALRAAETRLSTAVTANYQQARECSPGESSGGDSGGNTTNNVVICRQGLFEGSGGERYFDAAIWESGSAVVQTYSPSSSTGSSPTPGPTVQYVIEELEGCTDTVNPDVCARAAGKIRYRVTALARGANPAAIAVTQSIYERTFP